MTDGSESNEFTAPDVVIVADASNAYVFDLAWKRLKMARADCTKELRYKLMRTNGDEPMDIFEYFHES